MNYELTDIDHAGPIPAKRITWEDGQTWDVLVEIPYGVRSRIRSRASSLVKMNGNTFAPDRSDTGAMMEMIEEANMQRLVGCTVGWSWDMKVTRDAMESMSPRYVNDVLVVMRELHDDAFGVGSGDDRAEKKRLPSPSSTVNDSGVNGRAPVNTSQASSLE